LQDPDVNGERRRAEEEVAAASRTSASPRGDEAVRRLAAASRILVVGIGGGGDVAGALAFAEAARALNGGDHVVGGLTWERRPVDPLPGPRRLDEVIGLSERLHDAVGLAGPDTTGPGGFRFCESDMAAFLGAPVVLLDPNPGPAAIAAGLDAAAAALACDLVVLLDVGGDVLAHGDEPGLASPLADATVLAAAPAMATPVLGAIFGIGCDGELTPAEVLERLAEVGAAGGLAGARGLTPAVAARLEEAVKVVPTEASAQALRCFHGAIGPSAIRQGRRTVELSPAGALTFYFDPVAALRSAARLAAAVTEARDLDHANEILHGLGVYTELDYERDALHTVR
jgi:hypothetical protein